MTTLVELKRLLNSPADTEELITKLKGASHDIVVSLFRDSHPYISNYVIGRILTEDRDLTTPFSKVMQELVRGSVLGSSVGVGSPLLYSMILSSEDSIRSFTLNTLHDNLDIELNKNLILTSSKSVSEAILSSFTNGDVGRLEMLLTSLFEDGRFDFNEFPALPLLIELIEVLEKKNEDKAQSDKVESGISKVTFALLANIEKIPFIRGDVEDEDRSKFVNTIDKNVQLLKRSDQNAHSSPSAYIAAAILLSATKRGFGLDKKDANDMDNKLLDAIRNLQPPLSVLEAAMLQSMIGMLPQHLRNLVPYGIVRAMEEVLNSHTIRYKI